MTRKKHNKNNNRNNKHLFRVVLAIIVLLILFYLIYLSDRFNVVESDQFTETHLTPSGDYLSYDTEFCASKLSDLAHEYHFLESDIDKQEKAEDQFEKLPAIENDVIDLEQREMSIIKDEFDEYKVSCDQLDEHPTAELCSRFIQEAMQDMEAAQQSVQEDSDSGFLGNIEYASKSIRKAQRIYRGLQEHCEGIEYD